MPHATSRAIDLPDLAATERLASSLAARAERGDVIALAGGLGAGKTTFARAFVHARPGGGEIDDVPSPTFTLVQVYDLPGVAVWHFDLYRLDRPEDALELGIEDAFAQAITLVEWPDRLGAFMPTERLEVILEPGLGETSRRARLIAHGGHARLLAGIDE